MDEASIMALAAKAVLHSYGSGQRICNEGGPVTDFFIIERGVCIVTKWVRAPGVLTRKEIEALNDPVLGAPRPGAYGAPARASAARKPKRAPRRKLGEAPKKVKKEKVRRLRKPTSKICGTGTSGIFNRSRPLPPRGNAKGRWHWAIGWVQYKLRERTRREFERRAGVDAAPSKAFSLYCPPDKELQQANTELKQDADLRKENPGLFRELTVTTLGSGQSYGETAVLASQAARLKANVAGDGSEGEVVINSLSKYNVVCHTPIQVLCIRRQNLLLEGVNWLTTNPHLRAQEMRYSPAPGKLLAKESEHGSWAASRKSILDKIGYKKKVLAKQGQTDDDKKNDALVSAMNAGLPEAFRNMNTGFNYLHTRKSSTGRRKWKSQ